MSKEYISVDLDSTQKKIILDLASIFIANSQTCSDLKNPRKKWIRFKSYELSEIIGELSYYCNRSKKLEDMIELDDLISHLEYYETKSR